MIAITMVYALQHLYEGGREGGREGERKRGSREGGRMYSNRYSKHVTLINFEFSFTYCHCINPYFIPVYRLIAAA